MTTFRRIYPHWWSATLTRIGMHGFLDLPKPLKNPPEITHEKKINNINAHARRFHLSSGSFEQNHCESNVILRTPGTTFPVSKLTPDFRSVTYKHEDHPNLNSTSRCLVIVV